MYNDLPIIVPVGLIGFLAGLFLGFWCTYKVNVICHVERRDTSEDIITYTKGIKDYILLGMVNAITYIILYVRFGVSDDIVQDGRLITIIYCACTSLLLALVVIDWNTYMIPKGINVCIFILGLIRVGLDIQHWSLYIIGFFAVSGFLCLLHWISGGSWVGGGDIKLMAAAGLVLGWKLILVAFVAGCAIGSAIHLTAMAIKKKEHRLAFGPYLSFGIFISMIWGEQLAGWYLSLL